MFTPEQVRVYRSLELRYPEHDAPRKVSAPSGSEFDAPILDGLYFVIGEAEDIDCGGECGQTHRQYFIIPPIPNPNTGEFEAMGSLFGDGPVIENTYGESMWVPESMTLSWSSPVEPEDWPDETTPERVVIEGVEDPWADDGFLY